MHGLHRRQPPCYKAFFSARSQGLNNVNKEFGFARMPLIFALGDALAVALEAELGLVHPVWLGSGQEYGASGIINPDELQKYGLNPLCVRTWYGPHLVQL